MRTVLVAFAIGGAVIGWRSVEGRGRLLVLAVVVLALVAGALMVWNTRSEMALTLSDPSSSLRAQVAKVALTRIGVHPFFGHGMDSMHRHWNEWGFPGEHILHLHSTPLQIAFDRGLPAVVLWAWMVGAFWLAAARSEKSARESDDTNHYGVLLGVLGALTGFLASSLVNYNFGDAEVAMAFWWLAGLVVTLRSHQQSSCESGQTTNSQI
jgi:O-antigen ligase